VLAGLVLVSLLPYGIVRYFFGGVELMPNLFALVHTLAASAALGALFLGASGYPSYWMRTAVALGAILYVGLTVAVAVVFTPDGSGFGPGGTVGVLVGAGAVLLLLEVQAYFTLCGLQLARGRLRMVLHPWQVAPSRPVLMLFILGPLYFATGAVITCGLGLPIVAGLMIWWVASLDRAPKRPITWASAVPLTGKGG
jgi:hypothetical protein